MRNGIRSTLLALALVTAGMTVVGEVQAGKYPVNSTEYRKRMDAMIAHIRATCSARCPREAVAPMMAAMTKMEFRVTQACADGWVTEAEDAWVLSVVPDMPGPPPGPTPAPRPHPRH